jgi:hypothetical protein
VAVKAVPLRPQLRLPYAGVRPPFESLRSHVIFTVGASVIVGVGAGYGFLPAVAALIVALVALVILVKPAIGAYTLAAVVPAISGLRPGLGTPTVRLSEAIILLFAALILIAAKPGRTAPWGAFDWLALAYVLANFGLGIADLQARNAPLDQENLQTLIGPLQFFLLYRAVRTVLTTEAEHNMALRLMLLCSIPVSLLALLQQGHVPGIPKLTMNLTGTDAYLSEAAIPRAQGPFPHWHDLGGYLFVIVLIGVALLVTGAVGVMSRRLLAGVVGLAVLGVISTISFTPIAGIVVGSLFLFALARDRKRWFAAVALSAVLIGILFGPLVGARYKEQFGGPHVAVSNRPYLPQNFNFRIDVWKTEYAPVLRTHLTTGYGPDLPTNLVFAFTESIYVTLLMRGGVTLLVIYGALMVTLALRARELKKADAPEVRALGYAVFLIVVLAAFMQLVTNYFVNSGFPFLLWVLAALVFSSSVRSTNELRPLPGEPRQTS